MSLWVGKEKLRRNFPLMFWIQALLEVKMINVVVSIFLVFRGLTLPQIYYLSMIFSAVIFLTEMPSSYLADKWGRKKVIIVAVFLNVVFGIMNVFIYGFGLFAVAYAIFALSTALLAGTDEAMIYDTSRNLNEDEGSLKKLGQYFSAQRVFKIITPLLAVMIVTRLSNEQFIWLLSIDNLALLGALLLSFFLVEPKIHYRVEEMKKGVLTDAWKLIKSQPTIIKIIFCRTLVFVAGFNIWRVYSEYFRGLGVSIIWIGIMTGAYQLFIFSINLYTHKLFVKQSLEEWINFLNYAFILFAGVFWVNQVYWHNFWLGMVIFVLMVTAESVRWPLFSQVINKLSSSYNRATTLSLANMLNSGLQIPLVFLGSFLVASGYNFLFGLSLGLGLVAVIFFGLKSDREEIQPHLTNSSPTSFKPWRQSHSRRLA